jgi:hypothetical protein
MPTLAAVDSLLEQARGTDARAGYALALRAVTDLAALDRVRGLGPLLESWKERGRFDLAMRRTFAITAEDFERQWQRRTRWQFAFLAVAGDSALAGLVLTLGLWPMYRGRVLRQRRRLEALRAREAITDRASQSAALDLLLREIGPPRTSGGSQRDADA